jgi:hypothetical protein
MNNKTKLSSKAEMAVFDVVGTAYHAGLGSQLRLLAGEFGNDVWVLAQELLAKATTLPPQGHKCDNKDLCEYGYRCV